MFMKCVRDDMGDCVFCYIKKATNSILVHFTLAKSNKSVKMDIFQSVGF